MIDLYPARRLVSSPKLPRWSGHPTSQCRHIALHRPRNLHQRDKCQIVFAALDPADIAAIQPCLMRQSLLRHAKLATLSADTFAEDVEVWVHTSKSRQR